MLEVSKSQPYSKIFFFLFFFFLREWLNALRTKEKCWHRWSAGMCLLPVLCCVLKEKKAWELMSECRHSFCVPVSTRVFERAHLRAHWMRSWWKLKHETNLQHVSSCVWALLMQISANDTLWASSRPLSGLSVFLKYHSQVSQIN